MSKSTKLYKRVIQLWNNGRLIQWVIQFEIMINWNNDLIIHIIVEFLQAQQIVWYISFIRKNTHFLKSCNGKINLMKPNLPSWHWWSTCVHIRALTRRWRMRGRVAWGWAARWGPPRRWTIWSVAGCPLYPGHKPRMCSGRCSLETEWVMFKFDML